MSASASEFVSAYAKSAASTFVVVRSRSTICCTTVGTADASND